MTHGVSLCYGQPGSLLRAGAAAVRDFGFGLSPVIAASAPSPERCHPLTSPLPRVPEAPEHWNPHGAEGKSCLTLSTAELPWFVCYQPRVELGGTWSRRGWEVQRLSSHGTVNPPSQGAAGAEEPGRPSSPFPALQMEDYRSYWKSSWAQGWASLGKFHPDTSQSWDVTAPVVTAERGISGSEGMPKPRPCSPSKCTPLSLSPHRALAGPVSLSQASFSPGGIQELHEHPPRAWRASTEPWSPQPLLGTAQLVPRAAGTAPSSRCWLGLPVRVPSLPDSASELSVRTGLLISSQGWGGQFHPQRFMMYFFPIISKEALNSLRFCYCQHQKIV